MIEDPSPLVLFAPERRGAITLDGELEEEAWRPSARTHGFLRPEGGEARPFSEVRVLWDDQFLYLGLYAADIDIEAHATEHDGPIWMDDSFQISLQFSTPLVYAIDVSAGGVISDASLDRGVVDPTWESQMVVAIDRDGTPNSPADDDEEWVVEARIPWASFGVVPRPGLRFKASFSRCDQSRGLPRSCADWGARSKKPGRALDRVPLGAIELAPANEKNPGGGG